jgi:hypothetical protein
MNKFAPALFLAVIVLVAGIFTAEAKPEYAQRENKACGYCHLNSSGGGARGFRGQFYGANNLSFDKFEEARESAIAGVTPNSEAGDTKAKVAYVGAVSGEASVAWRQIQLAANRTGGVIAVFLDGNSDNSKSAAKTLRKLALGYGTHATVVGVFEGNQDKALKLTADLGSLVRVLPDPDGAAAKKFGVTQAFDMLAVSKMGKEFKLFSGYSKANLASAVAQMGTYGVEAPTVDIEDAPAEALHGPKIGS